MACAHFVCLIVCNFMRFSPVQVQWMAAPTDAPSDCPPGLEYLIHIDQVLVNQQIEVFECKLPLCVVHVRMLHCKDTC